VFLVGDSMGGKVAQAVAASRPAELRGLVLGAPAPAAPAVELDDDARRQLLGAYCGHLIPLEQPERLTNEIASFIERET
jgi:alpha-beta hydrolase superfamily lysophospholipase